jgi:hypothetical protein
LTAAHCAADACRRERTSIIVGSGANRAIAASRLTFAHVHPDFDPIALTDDVAVLELERPLEIEPIELWLDPLPEFSGEEVVVLGFGRTGPASADFGVLRAGTSRVRAMTDEALELEPAPSQPCSGDSGGAVLMPSGRGWTQIAIISQGDRLCAKSARVARVDHHAAFIRGAIRSAEAVSESCEAAVPHTEHHSRAGTSSCRSSRQEPTCGFGLWSIASLLVALVVRRRRKQSMRPIAGNRVTRAADAKCVSLED